jgi:hypothetical protein
MRNNRREFIKRTGTAGMAVMAIPCLQAINDNMEENTEKAAFSFISPVDGDMLSKYDGKEFSGNLLTKVRIKAPSGQQIKINGKETKFDGSVYHAEIELTGYENIISAADSKTGEKQSIKVFWLKNVVDKYRLSIDDNIWFLKDISVNSSKYKSIFENPYLKFLKELHDKYGTKIHLNLFYQTDGFNLSQMTDKFKSEWKDNAGWIRLSFHAMQEFPDRPYLMAGYDQVKNDCILVKDQIRRFAGEELMGPVTTLHWGAANEDGCRALKDQGYRALAGYFNAEGPDPVSYYLSDEKRLQINNRFLWKDNRMELILSRMAIVINTLKLEEIVPYLDSLTTDGHRPPYADLMIHEQYFYPSYTNYQPDFRDKVITSVKWAADKGYKPAFLGECVFS